MSEATTTTPMTTTTSSHDKKASIATTYQTNHNLHKDGDGKRKNERKRKGEIYEEN